MVEFKIKGIVFRFSFLFFAVITLFLFMDRSGLAVWGFIAALMHECGHVLLFILLDNKPQMISFEVSGLRLVQSKQYLSRAKEIAVVAAGPIVNFLMFSLLYLNDRWAVIAAIHLGIGLFNLLPVQSLDGGKLMRLLFLTNIDIVRADKIVKTVSFLIVIPMLLIGGYLALSGIHNLTLLITAIYLLITVYERTE